MPNCWYVIWVELPFFAVEIQIRYSNTLENELTWLKNKLLQMQCYFIATTAGKFTKCEACAKCDYHIIWPNTLTSSYKRTQRRITMSSASTMTAWMIGWKGTKTTQKGQVIFFKNHQGSLKLRCIGHISIIYFYIDFIENRFNTKQIVIKKMLKMRRDDLRLHKKIKLCQENELLRS